MDKSYVRIEASHFNRLGEGPWHDAVEVRANIDPNPHYPEERVYVGSVWPDRAGEARDVGAWCLTVEAARRLRDALDAACRDVEKACPGVTLRVAP